MKNELINSANISVIQTLNTTTLSVKKKKKNNENQLKPSHCDTNKMFKKN